MPEVVVLQSGPSAETSLLGWDVVIAHAKRNADFVRVGQAIIGRTAINGDLRASFDAVLGSGSFDKLAGDVYDELTNGRKS